MAKVKPGWKTTEFAGTMIVHIAAIALALLDLVDAQWAITAMAGVQSIYSCGRSWTKKAPATKR